MKIENKPSRELNILVATEVFGYRVFRTKGELYESHPLGDRPLRNYSKDIQWAWEVAEKMNVSLISTVENQWFALIGPEEVKGWNSPKAALEFLEAGKFNGAGAAVSENPALSICLAAIKACEKRKTQAFESAQQEAGSHTLQKGATTSAEESPAESILHH